MMYNKFPNNMTYKSYLLLSVFIITILASFLSLNPFARAQEKNKRGWKGRLCNNSTCKKQLLEQLKRVQKEADKYVDGYIINGSDIIAVINENDLDIKIKNSIIEGGLDFSNINEVNGERNVNNKLEIINSEIGFFWETKFDIKPVKLSFYNPEYNWISFTSAISFADSWFREKVNFLLVDFRNEVDFTGTTFQERVVFGGRFGEAGTKFDNATFEGGIAFAGEPTRTHFDGLASFTNTKFSNQAYFSEVTFNDSADFSHATFMDIVEFDFCVFSGDYTKFEKTIFEEDVSFYSAIFSREVLLRDVIFKKLVTFDESVFYKQLTLDTISSKYIAARNANIKTLRVKGVLSNIDFRDAKVSKAYFKNCIFEGDVDFSGAELGNLIERKNFIYFSEEDFLMLNKSSIS